MRDVRSCNAGMTKKKMDGYNTYNGFYGPESRLALGRLIWKDCGFYKKDLQRGRVMCIHQASNFYKTN